MANSDSGGAVYYDESSYYGSSKSGNNLKAKTGTSTSGQVQRVSVVPDNATYASNDSSYYGTSVSGSSSNSSSGNTVYSGIYNYSGTLNGSNYGSSSSYSTTGTSSANKTSNAINSIKNYYSTGGSTGSSTGVYAAASSNSVVDGVAIQSSRSAYTKPTEDQLNKYYEYLEKFASFDTPNQIYDDLGSVEKKLTSIEDSLKGCSGDVFKRVNTYLAQYKDYIQQARNYVSKSLSPVTEKVRILKGLLEQRAGKDYEVVDALEDQPFYYMKDSTDPVERQTYEELAALYTPKAAIAATQTTNKEELNEQINTTMKEIYDLSDFTFYDRSSMYDYLEGTTVTSAATKVDASELQSLTTLIETRYSELASKGYSKSQILSMLSDEIKSLSSGTDTAVAASKSVTSSTSTSTKTTTSDTEAELQRIYDQLKSMGSSGTYSQKETFEILDEYVKSGKSLSSISSEDLDKVVRLSSYTN